MRNTEKFLLVKWRFEGYVGFEYINLTSLCKLNNNSIIETKEYNVKDTDDSKCLFNFPKLQWKELKSRSTNFSLEYTDSGKYADGSKGDGLLGTANYFFEKDKGNWRCEWTAHGSTEVTDEPECRILDPNNGRDYRIAKQAMRVPYFRNLILNADARRCVLSDEAQEEALDAAHIVEVRSKGFDNPDNGITLRKDLHALFDARLFDINSEGYVDISDELSETYQKELLGKKIIPPNTLERVKKSLKERMSENRNA